MVLPPTTERHWAIDPPSRTRLLVMQPTPFCNISCNYCYLAGRNDSRLMSADVVRATADNLKLSGLLDGDLGVIWHAGEPLVAPVQFYEFAFESFARQLGAHTRIQHSIQTNATLVDQRWCDLFDQWQVRVGVSIDGPAHIHDLHRKTRNGKPTHALAMRGVQLLQRAGVPFHVIAVLTRDSLDCAHEIIEFFADMGVHDVGFNVDEQEGTNAMSTVAQSDSQHRSFMRRLVELQLQHENLIVRELEVAARMIQQELPRVRIGEVWVPDNSQVLPFAILSVATNGDFSTFSPELLDQRHPLHGSFIFGNVVRDSFLSMLEHERFQRIFKETLSGIERCRQSCEFFSFCGGGAPANKLAEHGTLASAETAYCRAVVQRPLEAVLETCERVRKGRVETSVPSSILNGEERREMLATEDAHHRLGAIS
jgi:uncharacterized protein